VVRTQIQLEEEQARRLKLLAQQLGVSMAEVIRRYVDRGLQEETPSRAELYARAASVIGRFPDLEGRTDLASEHDRYLEDAFE
jgi:predicted DNA-binding protein